jgi:hypothetical protein
MRQGTNGHKMLAFIFVSMGTAKHDVTLPSIFLLYKGTPGIRPDFYQERVSGAFICFVQCLTSVGDKIPFEANIIEKNY